MRKRDALVEKRLPTGQTFFTPKRGFGMIYYPALPETDKSKWPEGFIPDYEVTHPDDWPTWVQNIHSEHATVQVQKDGQVFWLGGTIHDGIWFDGVFHNGRWRDGIWEKGTWKNGIWSTGEWYNGTFMSGHWLYGVFFNGTFNGIWHGGIFMGGHFTGLWLGGVWRGGTFNGFRERSTTPPEMT